MDSIDKITAYIDKNFSEKRRKHTYGVRSTALELAALYGCDPHKTEQAALLHDLYRGVPENVLNYYVKHLGLDNKYLNSPNLSHGKIAAEMIQRDFGIKDRDIINAVSFHTTERNGMSTLEKIIYIADAVEPGRNYPGVEELRKLVKEDLDKACLASLRSTIDYVSSEGKFLDGDTLAAEQYFAELISKKEKSDDQ